ncbi:pirin family protein [Azorhizophilus paspali]|uniref:Pirin family protein n=1 Tax=Azorhizophilus paspali TaxID=69963 RepID=A0ABV6SJ24_AZOPA
MITTELRRANERGRADHGWLQSRHSFSFADYHDPEQIGFSDLRVINDDRVAPGQGFGRHPHRDMEILSYVLDGALEHRDSLGNGSLIRPGDIQLMRAGSGIAHSEFNASDREPVHFLQIWILPDTRDLAPGYQQEHFASADKRGRLCLILSPDGAADSLRIHQNTRVYAGLFDGAERATLELDGQRHAYVHLARGTLSVNGQRLEAGDGLRIRHAERLEFAAGEQAEVLVFDLRPNELPQRP